MENMIVSPCKRWETTVGRNTSSETSGKTENKQHIPEAKEFLPGPGVVIFNSNQEQGEKQRQVECQHLIRKKFMFQVSDIVIPIEKPIFFCK